MASLLNRPLDLVIVMFLASFLIMAVTFNFTQATHGPVDTMKEGLWPPPQIVRLYAWWCNNFDPLVAKNPMWLETMSWFNPFLYVYFYVAAIYAFVFEKEWIRVPALMWSYGLLLNMVVVVRMELFGPDATPSPAMFLLAYSAYVIIPILLMLRVAWTPVFPPAKAHTE